MAHRSLSSPKPTFALLLLAGLWLFAACGSDASPVTGAAEQPASPEVPPASEAEVVGPADEPPPTPDEPSQAASADAPPDPSPTPIEVITPVVFNDDFGTSIAPILTSGCASCHNAGGPGATHWRLETAADAVDTSQFVASVVASGYMPPWPASDDFIAYKNHRGLRDDQRQAIIDWAAAGGQIDIAADTPLVSPSGPLALGRVDTTVSPPEPYQGSTQTRDDYRCLIYDPDVTETVGLAGYNFVPDQVEVVHHAVGYLFEADARDVATAADERSPGAGWPCFGGAGLPANDSLFLAWAPGQDPTEFPQGSAMRLDPGDFMVIQIHYHYEIDAPADQSALELMYVEADPELQSIEVSDYLAPAEIPCRADEAGPLCDRDAAIANAISKYGRDGVNADDALAICGFTPEDYADMTDGLASASCVLPVYEFGEIISVLGHEHELGASFRMTLNPGRPDEQVLLDIPKWDFNWQYNYEPVEGIELTPGDSVLIECSWDRSLRDPSLEPAYIVWADGTDDEMCFATIMTRS